VIENFIGTNTTKNLAYCQGITPGVRTPGKFARSYARENSWQSYQGQPLTKVVAKCRKKKQRFLFSQKKQDGTLLCQGLCDENHLENCKASKSVSKACKATWVACKFAEKPANELTKEPLGSMVVCEGQDPRTSLDIWHLYIASSPFSSFTALREIFFSSSQRK